MTPYPLQFRPLFKPKVWGGRTLERLLGKALPAGQRIGESWELADLPDSVPAGRSIIDNGALAGSSLHQVLQDERHRTWIMGDAPATRCTSGGGPHRPGPGDGDASRFPLLIKYLDARENLSVQVHPSPQYAQRHREAHLKSEAWVILDAEPGAAIYKGVRPGVSRENFAAHIESGEVVNDLRSVPARVGDCHYLPSGTVHALGAGIVVAEVQTRSDTTFRVYDWGREAAERRELHVAQALECIEFSETSCRTQPARGITNERAGIAITPLCQTEHFAIDRTDAAAGSEFAIVMQGQPQVWMIIAGGGRIEGDFGAHLPLALGATILLPAGAEGWHARFAAETSILCVSLPSPLRNMLA